MATACGNNANVRIMEEIKGNGRPKLLIIGKTGTGKSTLCNVITGSSPNANLFPVSAEAESCTQKTVFADAFFNGDKTFPISVIDTIGFDDPVKNEDAAIIAELVDKLKNDCDYINLFAIAVNGQNPRLDGSLVGMIKIFEGMFTKQFWSQVVIVFTRLPMETKSRARREKNSGQSDHQLARKYMNTLQNQFKDDRGLRYLFLDALYDEEDEVEQTAFDEAMASLRKDLEMAPALPTVNVTKVETETAALKRQIKEKAEERRRMEEEFKAQVADIQRQFNEDKAESERRIKELQDKLNKRPSFWDILGEVTTVALSLYNPLVGSAVRVVKDNATKK